MRFLNILSVISFIVGVTLLLYSSITGLDFFGVVLYFWAIPAGVGFTHSFMEEVE